MLQCLVDGLNLRYPWMKYVITNVRSICLILRNRRSQINTRPMVTHLSRFDCQSSEHAQFGKCIGSSQLCCCTGIHSQLNLVCIHQYLQGKEIHLNVLICMVGNNHRFLTGLPMAWFPAENIFFSPFQTKIKIPTPCLPCEHFRVKLGLDYQLINQSIGYPSAKEAETANVLNLQTELWARRSTSLLLNSKRSEESLGRDKTPRKTYNELYLYCKICLIIYLYVYYWN